MQQRGGKTRGSAARRRLRLGMATGTALLLAGGLAIQTRAAAAPLAPQALAETTLPLKAFFGDWHGVGTAQSDIDPYLHINARDLDVDIHPVGKGFRIRWTTVMRDSGSPMQPKWEKHQAELTFVPAGRKNVWREAHATDPMERPYAWAHIKGHSLIVTLVTITADGGLELQVYERTVADGAMELQFTRMADGERIRRAKGRLTRLDSR